MCLPAVLLFKHWNCLKLYLFSVSPLHSYFQHMWAWSPSQSLQWWPAVLHICSEALGCQRSPEVPEKHQPASVHVQKTKTHCGKSPKCKQCKQIYLWKAQRWRAIVTQKGSVGLQGGQVSSRGRVEVSNCKKHTNTQETNTDQVMQNSYQQSLLIPMWFFFNQYVAVILKNYLGYSHAHIKHSTGCNVFCFPLKKIIKK